MKLLATLVLLFVIMAAFPHGFASWYQMIVVSFITMLAIVTLRGLVAVLRAKKL
ncbi:hypothetical protein [Pseudolabrys sp.]|uniref:hypothetical protein n=1 Tax=Pseudolabrys sp. TaxID=1960880 RepID=UPI003D09C672